jgi:hypothetical protein
MKQIDEKMEALSNLLMDLPSSLFTPLPFPLRDEKRDQMGGFERQEAAFPSHTSLYLTPPFDPVRL